MLRVFAAAAAVAAAAVIAVAAAVAVVLQYWVDIRILNIRGRSSTTELHP